MAFKKLLKSALIVSAMAFGGMVATAAPAQAAFQCTAVAFNALDRRIRGTRAVVVRRFEGRACRAALRVCEDNLDGVRFATGRPRPFARCEVVRVVDVQPRFRQEFRSRPVLPPPPAFDDHRGRGCNFVACDERYRSFRASDCSFQPYNGPRRRCTL